MSRDTPTPVEEWAPIFTRYFSEKQLLDPGYALNRTSGGTWCKLCDAPTPRNETDDQHLRKHRDELRKWKRRRKRAAEKARDAGAKAARVEKKKQRDAGIK